MTVELHNNAKNASALQCECGKSYKYRQGLFSHKNEGAAVGNRKFSGKLALAKFVGNR